MKQTKTTVKLGTLGLGETFHFPRCKTVYRTIDYRPSNTNISYGTRSCFNTRTGKAELIACSKKVSYGT